MTYRELNQIFYENNKFDTPNKIATLEPFFYNIHNLVTNDIKKTESVVVEQLVVIEEAIKKDLCDVVEESVVTEQSVVTQTPVIIKEHIKKTTSNRNNNIFEPKQKDTIFWCIFMYVYGYGEYSMIGSRYGNRELEEKQKMISFFKENPKALKTTNHKITNGNIQEIYSEYLSFQNETTLLGVIGLTVFYNIRILLVDHSKKIYMDFHTNDVSKTCVLFKNSGIRGQTKYTFDMSITDENIQTIQNTMLCLEHYTKPLKAISTYTVKELEGISNKLNITNKDSNKKFKKQELYSQITEYCGSF